MATEHDSVDLVDGSTVLAFVQAALLAALLGASSLLAIPIPFSPAPVTLQVLLVFLAGLYLGPYWGSFSVLLYLLAGGLGAPVFAGGMAGPGVLVGETAGYLWSYPIAAALIGLLIHGPDERRNPAERSVFALVGVLIAAVVVIYAFGTAYMAWLLELDALTAIAVGVLPFVPGELLKIAAAVAIVTADDLVSPARHPSRE